MYVEQDTWRDILERASKLREQINIQLWIDAVIGTTLYSPAMAGLYKPALIELSPDRFLPRQIIQQAVNESVRRQVGNSGKFFMRRDFNQLVIRPLIIKAGTCTNLDENTGGSNGIENALWYFREDIQVNAQHWYWHLSYPTSQRANRRGELFYFFHQSMLAR